MGEIGEEQRTEQARRGLNGMPKKQPVSKDQIVRTYDLKLHNGGLLWHELKAIAQVMENEEDRGRGRVREIVLDENLLNRKTVKTAANLYSYLNQRLLATSPSIVKLIASADSLASKQACLVASVSSNRMLREFFRDVVSEKLESLNPILPSSFWRSFWSSCVSKSPKLGSTREKTVDEIRQKTLSFLVDFNILDNKDSQDLKPIKLTPKLQRIVTDECDREVQHSLRAFL